MRRPAAVALLAGILLGLASVAMALTESVADDFSSGGYSGSTGTADWASNWSEIGESDGAGAGSVRVKADSDCATGKCLVIEKLVGGLQNLGARRAVSLAGASSAILSYDVVFPGGLLVDGVIEVEASSDGAGWSLLRSHPGGTADRFEVALPLGEEVAIRFVASDLSLATSAAIDDIEIEVKRPDPTTTTTSTTTTATTTTTIKTTTSTTAATTTSTSAPTTTTTATTVLRQTEPSPTTSTTTAADSSTTTTRPGRPDTTTTTTVPDRSAGPPVDVTTTLAATEPTESTEPPPVVSGQPPSATEGVVTDIDPGLAPSRQTPQFAAQEDLLVRFGLAAEDISLDILGNVVLGLVLGWAWLKRES